MQKDRFVGCLLGVAIGDALGAPFENMPAEEIAQIPGAGERYFDGSVNTHRFAGMQELKPGDWTDDTQLTLAVARSFQPDGRFDMDRVAREHIDESTRPFGWGGTTRKAVRRLAEGTHWSQSAEPNGAGNGVVMKIAPLGLAESLNQDIRLLKSEGLNEQGLALGRMTHGHPAAVIAGVVHANVISVFACLDAQTAVSSGGGNAFVNLTSGLAAFHEKAVESHEPLISSIFIRLGKLGLSGRLDQMTAQQIAAEFGGGTKAVFTAWNSVGTAYACFLRNQNSFKSVQQAVLCGGDADSNASIVGSLLGALHGPSIFPAELVAGLNRREEVVKTAELLHEAVSRRTE